MRKETQSKVFELVREHSDKKLQAQVAGNSFLNFQAWLAKGELSAQRALNDLKAECPAGMSFSVYMANTLAKMGFSNNF